jgi:hypothetical protein
MAQNFTSFTPIEEAEPQAPATFTSFIPIEEEPAWAQNYVPRQPQGPVRTVQGKVPPPAPAVEPPEPNAMGDDFGAAIMDVAQPKRESVMEGFKGTPPTVDYAENRRARDRSVSPESVMFNPAQQLDAVDAQIYAKQYQDKKSAAAKQAARDKLRQDAEAEDYGVTNFLKDTGVDLAKGTAGVGEAYVGLLDITSGGAAGRVLSDKGYDPKGINKFLTGFQSITRKNQDRDVKDAQGFLGTLKELSVNPASLVGGIVESIPGTLTSGVAAGRYIRFLTDKASKEALAKGLVGAEAETFIKNRVTQQTIKIAAVASGTEGAQTSGSIAEAGRQAGKDWNEYVLPALAAGFNTTAIGLVSGKVGQKLGIGDIETGAVGTGSFAKRFTGEVLKEGFLEELPQGTQEQIFRNIATGWPWDENVDKAAAQSVAAGMGMAAANASKNQAVKSVKEAIAGKPALEEPTRIEPKLEPELEAAPEVEPTVTAPKGDRVTQLAEEIQKRTNLPIENATRIAEERIAAQEKANAPAETKAEGAEDVRPSITTAGGTSVPMVGQPDTDTTAGGAGVAEPDRMVSAGQDVAGTVGREASQPIAINQQGELSGIETPEAVQAEAQRQKAPAVAAPVVGKTLIDEFKELNEQGKVTPEDAETVQSWMQAGDSPGVFGKKLFTLINEIERRPAEEVKAEEPAPVAVDPVAVDPVAFAQRSADSAIAEQGSFESLEESIGAHRDNIADSLREQGVDDQPTIDKAIAAYDEAINKQEAPAETTLAPTEVVEPTEPPKKRGRKPLERTEEQKQVLLTDRKQRKKDYDNADYQLKKLNVMLDEALAPLDEDIEADKVDAAEVDKEKAKKYVATKLLELSANPNLRGTAVGKRIKDLLNDRSKISEADINAAKRGIEIRAKTDLRGEIGESFQGKSALASRTPVKAKPNTAFNKATNASQALTIVARTGNAFQKFLANRLRAFTNGVTFVVLERGDSMPAPLRESMETANGLYSRGTRTVYVKGESWGNGQGINNITVLHELLHAATDRRIALGKAGKAADLVKQLTDLAERVRKQYELMDKLGLVPDELRQRVEATIVAGPDGTAYYDIFNTPQEFLAYGMSDEVFQEFLGRAKGTQNENGFSSFVRSIYDAWAKAFGKEKNEFSAMSDLINITDKILDEKPTSKEVLPARTFASEEPEESTGRTADQLKQATNRALNNVARSREGEELGKAVSVAAALRDPRLVWRELKLAWGGLNNSARTVFSHVYDLEAIAKGPGENIKSLQDLYEAIQKKNGMTESILRSAGEQSEQVIRFFNAHPKSVEIFKDLVNASTTAKYDPSNPNNKNRDKALDAMYNSLPQRGKEVYKDLRDYYKDMNDFQRQLISDQIEKLDLPADERDKVMAGIREIFEGEKVIEPYFPLMRYGEYILEYGKGDNRVVVRYETERERNRAALEYAKSRDLPLKYLRENGYVKISDDVGSSRMRKTIEGTSKLLKATYEAVDSSSLTEPGAKEAIKDRIYQSYLATMPEGSVRKMFLHRKGTAGYSSDVVRNINSMGVKMSRQFANLRYGPDIRNAVDGAYKAIEDDPTYKAFVERAAELAANALQAPEQTKLDKFYDSAAGFITKAAYIRYMTSWSSAIMQPMDILMRGIPNLLGNHGPKGPATLLKMLKFWNQYGVAERNADGTTSWRMPSIERAKGLSPLERRAVREMIAWGVSTDTLSSTVFTQSSQPTTSVGLRRAKDVTSNLVLGGLMHHGERLSREIIFLTSFRLNMEKFKDFDKAIKTAVDETTETFGNYSQNNRPLIMQGAGGRVLTMYKFFPLVTYKNLIGNFYKMMPLLNKEDKVKAATKFFGVLGTHLLIGGLTALPMFTVIMTILGSAWNKWGRDPDAPDEMKNLDYITWWKTEFMPQQFGDEWSDILQKGISNKLTGWELSGRLSLDNMWFREPSTPSKTNKDTFLNWALALGGPAPNLVISTMNGMQDMANGEYMRGLEKLTPGSIGNYLTAYRYATEGVQTPQGVQLAEPGAVPTSEIVGQAIGFRPAALSTAQDLTFRAASVEKQIVMEKQNLEQKYKDNFRKSIDPTLSPDAQQRFDDKWLETVDKIIDFNLRNPTKQIDMETLEVSNAENINKAVRKEIFGGVDINEKNIELLAPVSNEAEKALSGYAKKPDGKPFTTFTPVEE